MKTCPALLVSAPASGQGKTTVTAALARRCRQQGLRVRVFKTGPDFLDPLILERASGAPVYQLDLWMGGEDHCRALLQAAAAEADLILVEGVMGLFDGICSSADLAQRFGLSVLLVIDASAMAQTFAALAWGLVHFRPELAVAGVVANRVAGAKHAEMLGLPASIPLLGWLARNAELSLPERHLGLHQASAIADLDQRLDQAAQALQGVNVADWPCVSLSAPNPAAPMPRLLAGQKIAIAYDAAFQFLYRANVDTLQNLGAEIVFFSPIAGESIPAEADALYLVGGYPELHLPALISNQDFWQDLRQFHAANKPIVAECGGMMVLTDAIVTVDGQCQPMAGLLAGQAQMHTRLSNLGMHSALLPEGELRGHTFHFSSYDGGGLAALTHSQAARFQGQVEAIYRLGRLTASYVHWYFPSAPLVAAQLFLARPLC